MPLHLLVYAERTISRPNLAQDYLDAAIPWHDFLCFIRMRMAQFLNFIALQQIFKNRADFEQPSHFLMKSGLNWADKW